MSEHGRFIVLEGGEGAGKSTQAAFVEQWLRRQGRQVCRTREPGGSPLAEAIRELVLGQWQEGLDAHTELLLMFAARAAHLQATIRPQLQRGVDVVCDRFVDASYAYQGGGRGIALRHLKGLSDLVLQGLKPDLVLLLDIEPEQGLARARARGDGNRFEAENLAFQRRVREHYLARAAAAPSRYEVIDAALPLDQVQQQVVLALERHL